MSRETLNRILIATLLAFICAACSRGEVEVPVNTGSAIYPDYMGVTVPSNIAPLNFHYTSAGIRKVRTTVSNGDAAVEFTGKDVVWDIRQWKPLLASAEGDTLSFSEEISVKGGRKAGLKWEVYVSADRIDP